MKMSMPATALVFLLFLPCAAFGEIYGWVDENGVKRYSNDPPPPGVTVFTQQTEIVTDDARDENRMKSDQQYFDELKNQADQEQEQAEAELKAPQAVDRATVEEDDDEAFHEERIRRRTRVNSSPAPGVEIRPRRDQLIKEGEKARINPRTEHKTTLPK